MTTDLVRVEKQGLGEGTQEVRNVERMGMGRAGSREMGAGMWKDRNWGRGKVKQKGEARHP